MDNESSRQIFETDPTIKKIRRFVTDNLEDDFGHGLQHAIKVSHDAGALMQIESRNLGYTESGISRRVCIVQCAGLLHDIKRKSKDHSKHAAAHAREILKSYPFSSGEIEDICRAIENHEAFKNNIGMDTQEGKLVSDCLYDADKFRWGPDNFTHTIWDMVLYHDPPLEKFIDRYPKGMEKIETIKATFRTPTGKKYGPQFIDIGLAIGKELYNVIKVEFSQFLE